MKKSRNRRTIYKMRLNKQKAAGFDGVELHAEWLFNRSILA
jgi:hypothetical protein